MELKVMRSVLTGAALLGLIACSSQQTVGPQGSSGSGVSIPMPITVGLERAERRQAVLIRRGVARRIAIFERRPIGRRLAIFIRLSGRLVRIARRLFGSTGRLFRRWIAGRFEVFIERWLLWRRRLAIFIGLSGWLFRRRFAGRWFAGRWFVPLRRLVGLVGRLVRFSGLRRHSGRGRLGGRARRLAVPDQLRWRRRLVRLDRLARRPGRCARLGRRGLAELDLPDREHWRHRRGAEPVSHG